MSRSGEDKARPSKHAAIPRREFLAVSSAVAAGGISGRAFAETLADVPERGPGAPLSPFSERSSYVHIARVPEAGPGQRPVDADDAINSKSPLDKFVGTVTPSDLHYERSHAGVPDLDPAAHRLLVHGMVQKSLIFSMADLSGMPSISRTAFLECTGNGWENWKKADPRLTVRTRMG
jgi:sulfane dehydrogenase subunit SoxC